MSVTTPGYIEVPIYGNWLTKPVTLRVTMHGDDAYDIENFKPCLVSGRYTPYNRWHVIEAVHALGLDVLDDYLPFAIEDPDTIVYAVVPLTPDNLHTLRSLYGTAQYSNAVHPPVAAFPVPTLPRDREDLLTFARDAQDACYGEQAPKAIVLLGADTRLAEIPVTLWRIVHLRNHQHDLFLTLYRLFFEPPSGKPAPRYSIAKSWWSVERKCAPAPFRSPGGYEPFTRWEIVEMVHSFGLDVMDNVLPYVINNDYEIVYAMLPNDKLSRQIYRTYLSDRIYPHSESSHVGIRVTDHVNILDEFIEMLTCSSNDLIIVTALNKIAQVNVGALRKRSSLFTAVLRHNVLRRALSTV
jgi:hypothetical protein